MSNKKKTQIIALFNTFENQMNKKNVFSTT